MDEKARDIANCQSIEPGESKIKMSREELYKILVEYGEAEQKAGREEALIKEKQLIFNDYADRKRRLVADEADLENLIKKARQAALEEAAKVAETYFGNISKGLDPLENRIAHQIRQLKGER